ncbi:MAG: glycerol-3-phosphate 1-O-acyltransferase PlsY [Acidimicrobiia bacterium]|nr:glycerol-3-phosphate 1-O-acyltransferase PlsY [Acidimicrobiia bacterium]
MEILVIVLAVAAYLLGSVNSAVWVARSRGVDIYSAGSGNPGASNAFRTMGKGAAVLVYVGDLAKGFIPAIIASIAWGLPEAFAVGLFAVVGHCYPLYHGFRGGKGVATAGGVLLATVPLVVLTLAAIYAILVRVTKISSVGSLSMAALAIPGVAVAGVRGWSLGWWALTIALIIWRHRGNIARLLGGSENKVVTE